MYGGFLTKMISISVAGICVFCIAACGAVETPVSTIMPTATVSPVRTATHTSTPMPTNTPTLTPSPTTLPIMDRDLSAIVLQPAEIPDYYIDVQSYSGPSCLEGVYAELPDVHENLVNGFDREYLSIADLSFFVSSIFVYADEKSAQTAYRKIIHEWMGNLLDVPEIGSESFGGVMVNLYYGMYLMDIVWRSDEAVMELVAFAIRRPDDDEMVRMAREIQRRLDNPPSPAEDAAEPIGGGSGKIAFITDGKIVTVRSDGSDWTCIAGRNPTSVAYSPDGGRLAFTAAKECPPSGLCTDRSEIYIARSDGSEMTPLPSPWSHDPVFSPDGSQILFAATQLVPYTTNNTESFLKVVHIGGGAPEELAELGSADYGWSPDGSTTAFTCKEEKQTDICTMNADGSGLTNLTHDKAGDRFLQFSPDGKQILFASDREEGRVSLFLIDAGGGVPQALIAKSDKVPFGSWSPDGDRIAYVYNYHTDIFTISPGGGDDTQLTDLTAADICPVWSADGKKIVFLTQRNKAREIFIMNADGSDQKFLAAMGGYDDYCPVWVPG